MDTATKHYADRNAMALDKAGGYYARHVSAMTTEQLHSKSDIAAELGWRDMEIDRLQAAVEAQCVPDGWQLVRTDALKMAIDFAVPAMERDRDSPSNSAWMVEAADRNINAVRAMLASAPPAPQPTIQHLPSDDTEGGAT